MSDVKVGQLVLVDTSGLQAPAVSAGAGIRASGTITAIDPDSGQITVRLIVPFRGLKTVVVPADSVKRISGDERPES